MKKKILIATIVFFSLSSCNNTNEICNCLNEKVFFCSFESFSDLINHPSLDSSMLYGESSPVGGTKSLKVCSCCNNPKSLITLPKIMKAGEYQLSFYGKNNWGNTIGSIKLLIEDNIIYSTFIVKDTTWRIFKTNPIYFEAGITPKIEYWVTGTNNVCILIDNMEFIRLN